MITEEQKKLIERKEAQIERLKAEIKTLRGETIKSMTTNKMARLDWYGNPHYDGKTSEPWNRLLKLVLELHGPNHSGENLTTNILSEDEKRLSAKMADEVIPIWNRYFEKVMERTEK